MASAWDIIQSQPLPANSPPSSSARSTPSDWDIVASAPPPDEDKQDSGALHELWQEGVVNPAKQVASGYFRASAGAAHMLGNAAELVGKVTGTEPGGLFREGEKYYGEQADELSGGRKDLPSQIYQGIGAAPVEIAKYGLASEALGPAAGMGAAEALTAADKGPKQALIAGAKGALTGQALGLMAPASTTARVAGGTAMFGGQTAMEGGSPWDIVASSITGGVMGATSGAKPETAETPRVAVAGSGPIEEMPTSSLTRMLQLETNPAKRLALIDEARNRGLDVPTEAPGAVGPAESSAMALAESPDYVSMFDQADKRLASAGQNRQTRRASASVPETGVPENVARAQDARERLAQSLTGRSYADLNNPDRLAIDDLVSQGYISAPSGFTSTTETAAATQTPPEDATLRANNEATQAASTSSTRAGVDQPGAVGEGTPVPQSVGSSYPARYGSGTIVRIPGEEGGVEARYALRELSDVQPSHNPFNFEPNPEYEIRNDRDYRDREAASRVVQNAQRFEPSYLISDNPDATNGPPIIDRNGNVLGGNSRTMILNRVYEAQGPAAAAYRNALQEKAAQFGLDPADVAAMRRPALVREASRDLTPEQAAAAVTDLNKVPTAALKSTERALADSRRLSGGTLDLISQRIDEQGPDGTLSQALAGPGGIQILQKLVDDGAITPQERPGYIDQRPGGSVLTQDAKNRISRLMLGKFFDSPDQLDRTPADLRNKLERIVAPLARLTPDSEWNIAPHVREALDVLESARQHGIRNLDDLRTQQEMFGDAGGNYSPQAFAIAKTLQQGPLKVAQAFRQYATDARYAEEGNLLGNAPTADEAFGAAFPDSPPVAALAMAAGEAAPASGQRTNESGSIAADLLTAPARAVGLDKFVQQDVIPAAAGAARRVSRSLDDIKKLLAPQTRGPLAQKAAGMIRERGATLAQSRDRAVNALQEAKKYFDSKSPGYNLQFIDAVENGRTGQLPMVERRFANTIRQLISQRSVQLKRLGLLDTFYTDYFPHLWKDPDAAANWLQSWFARRPMAGSEAYRKQRTYPTMMDGINDPGFHMEPAFTNPVDFVLAKLGEMDKSITAHQIVEDFKSAGDLKPLPSGQKLPAGFARIDDRIANGYVAPEPLATVINNHLAPGLSHSPLFQVWRGLNNTMNMIDLSLSYYHGLTTTLNSSLSDMALGLKQTAAGKPIAGAAAVARGFTPFASVVQDVLKGTKLLKVWDGAPAPDPMTAALVDAIKSGGGRARQDATYSQHYADGFMQALRSYNLPGAAIRLPFAALEKAMAPIMEYLVPRAKLGAFAKRAQMELERTPNMTPDQARQVFGATWDSIDNRFGQFVYSNLFMNRVAKDLMMAVVGRPGWNLGTVREIGGGFADLAQAVTAPLAGNKPQLTDRAAFTTALFLGGAAINGLLNYVLTGTPPQGVDYIAPRDGGLNEDGRPSRIVLPTYLSKDLYSYATRPLATLKAKAAPALSVASDLLTNRDFQNRKIYGDEGIGLESYAREAVTPYSVQGLEKNIERNQPPLRTFLPLVGVMPAGRQVGKSKAEQLMAEYQQEAMPNTRMPESDRNRIKNRITDLMRSGKNEMALKVASDAYNVGSLTDADIDHAIDRTQFSPLVADFKRLSLDQAINVIAASTPHERVQLIPELAGRLDRAFDRLPPQEQARIEGRIQKLNLASR